MNFDIRFPLGLLFSLFGVALVISGLVSEPANYRQSLGININLVWGTVLVHFSLIMLVLALYKRNKSLVTVHRSLPKK